MSEAAGFANTTSPEIRTVYTDRPWTWLMRGWQDLRQAPLYSLLFGFVYALAGWGLTIAIWVTENYFLVLPLTAGFLLIGPIIAVGLYNISRRLERGEPVQWRDTLTAWRSNPTQIAFMGLTLVLFMIAWFRFAVMLFYMFFSYAPPPPDPYLFLDAMLTYESLPFLVIGTAIGAVFAGLAFAISVVTPPLLLDRPEASVFQGIFASVQVVQRNFWTMALWAWLIALFIGVSLITGYVLLIVTLPLIGHASWHAYRETVHWPDRSD